MPEKSAARQQSGHRLAASSSGKPIDFADGDKICLRRASNVARRKAARAPAMIFGGLISRNERVNAPAAYSRASSSSSRGPRLIRGDVYAYRGVPVDSGSDGSTLRHARGKCYRGILSVRCNQLAKTRPPLSCARQAAAAASLISIAASVANIIRPNEASARHHRQPAIIEPRHSGQKNVIRISRGVINGCCVIRWRTTAPLTGSSRRIPGARR